MNHPAGPTNRSRAIAAALVVAAFLTTLLVTVSGCADTGQDSADTSATSALGPGSPSSAVVPRAATTTATAAPSPVPESVLFPVRVERSWGYIDKTGSVVVEPQFDEASPFSEGLGRVRLGDEDTGKYGFVDASGKIAVPPRFAFAGSFSDGLALARQEPGGLNGYVDKSGQWVIEPRFGNCTDFAEGLAPAQADDSGLTGCIDRTGEFVIQPRFFNELYFFEGVAVALDPNGPGWAAKKGYVDKTGAWIIEPQYEEAERFREGLAFVVRTQDGQSETAAYIDKDGTVLFTLERPQQEPASGFELGFSEGLAVWVGEDGRLGFIDRTGAFAVPPVFSRATAFSEGLAAVAQDPGTDRSTWGYIDTSGAWVVEPQFLYASPFRHGLAEVGLATPSGYRQGYIDHSGQLVWQAP